MMLKRAVVPVMLAATSAVLARPDAGKNPFPGWQPSNAPVPSSLKPRRELPKPNFVVKPSGESRLCLKFRDDVKARVTPTQGITALPTRDTDMVSIIAAQYDLHFVAASKRSEAALKAITDRAAAFSHKAQPDLGGMVYVQGNPETLQAAANALLSLDCVEHIQFVAPFRPFGVAACGPTATSDCFTVDATPFCTEATCCDTVCNIRPFCCQDPGGEWDEICVAIANLFCVAQGGDPCLSAFAGNCFEEHIQNGGCNNPTCCAAVCAIDSFCCTQVWDQICVDLADDNCVNPNGGGATPDFTPQQGYLRAPSYADQPGGTPAGLSLPADIFPEYTGEGWGLFDDSLMVDNPTVTPKAVRWAGLYGLGRNLLEQYHVGDANGARGLGIKVAVIEWACFKNHEDLNVISEPGQTLITILDVGFPDHATACLGVINGQENGFGVTGVAPDAKAYFFPLVSVEEGPREVDAFLSCYETLGPGDVVSCSFGGGGNLHTVGFTNTLIQVGTDLGITTCVAAGNDCLNLDDTEEIGDAGAIVVGAGTPGDLHCRIPFSNHYEEGTGSQVVHAQAWGECVTTCAGAVPNLWFPNGNWNRSYTSGFNGTSAATPQICGLVACLQGLAKQFYGLPMSPSQIRTVLTGGAFPQCGIPSDDNLPGFDDALGCGPDLNFEESPNKIGPYPSPRDAGAFLLNQESVGFDDAPFVDDLTILRGTLKYGNKFSIKGSDDNYLVVDTLYTDRKFHPSVPGPGSKVKYYGGGQTADLMVTAHATQGQVNNLFVQTELTPPSALALVFTELYDWNTGAWVNIGVDQLAAGGGDVILQHDGTNATRFVNQSDLKVLARVYTLGLGYNGPPGSHSQSAAQFTMQYDLINVFMFGSFGGGGNGDPGSD